jgi:hypothetical protein
VLIEAVHIGGAMDRVGYLLDVEHRPCMPGAG